MPIESLRDIAGKGGEPTVRSGKQELLEQLINMYLE
jgi:xylose isomerase